MSETPDPPREGAASPTRRTRFSLFAPVEGMPSWVPHLLRQVVGLIVLLWLLLTVGRRLQGFLILLLISMFLAIALEPAVAFLTRRGWKPGLATGAIFLLVFLVGVLFIGLMIPLIIDEVAKLVDRMPSYVDRLTEFASRYNVDISGKGLNDALASIDTSLQGVARNVAGHVFGVGSRLIATIFQGLTIALFTFYLTAEAPKVRRAVLSVLSPDKQVEVLRVIEIAIEKTGGYFYSRALLAAVAGTATWLALTIIGVPFALPLGLWLGILSQFIPVIGTYIGGLLPLLIALLESPTKGLWVLGFIVVYQQIENYLISPRITGRTMSLHPAVAFGSAIVGGTLMGAVGAVMALPVAATVQAFVSTYLHRHELVESELLGDTARRKEEAEDG
ncbi:MAG: AI-2E family transporter [Acidimicrobiia bacterium]|jgi:predicted PurR-regulated permease PerM